MKTDEKLIPALSERERKHWEFYIKLNPERARMYEEWEKIDPRIMEEIRSLHDIGYLNGYVDTKNEIEKVLHGQVASFLENI